MVFMKPGKCDKRVELETVLNALHMKGRDLN